MAGSQRGFILLPVVLAIVLIATIAFLVSTQSAIDVDMTANTTVAAEAEQVARAGLAHAIWGVQNSRCAGDMGMTTVPFGQAGVGDYSASVTTPGGGTTAYPNLASDQDAWFRSDNITTNNGTTTSYHLRRESGALEYAVVRFDLSSLPAGAQINSALARFYVKSGKGHPEGPVTVHRVTADWTETDATWETLGDKYDGAVLDTIPAQPAAGDARVSVNLTAQVQAWVNGGEPNYGIMLIPAGEGTHAEYTSREGDVAERPRLDVVVGNGAASPATIQVTGTLTGNPSPANDITRTLTRTAMPAYQITSTMPLQPGPEGKDAMIHQWKPVWNYGADVSLDVEDWGSDSDYYSLLQFNLGRIPHGAKIYSAQLALYQNTTSTDGGSVGVRRITSEWVEGAGNGSTAAGVTWNERDTGLAWTTPGGDFASEDYASTTIPAGTRDWINWDITGLVSGWVSGSYPNHGLALVPESTAANAYFESSDATDPTLRPRLTVSYACECGSSCLSPQGTGNVLMVVGDNTLSPADTFKQNLLESWGYTVSIQDDNTGQSAFDSNIAASDVVFVSESVDPGVLAGKLAGAPIGVVSEEGLLNDDLGISNNAGVTVGSAINVIDVSHYITTPFPPGPLEIYDAGMEQLVIFNGPAPDLQTLADVSGYSALVTLEAGAALKGGATAAGRRVMLPFGRDANKNWDYINANGRLILHRALQWGMNADGGPPPKNLLFVAAGSAPTALEQLRIDLIEAWGYTVNLIVDSDSQANFDAAAAANDVAYVSSVVDDVALGTKLLDATIGIVNENMPLGQTFGFDQGYSTKSRDQIRVVDNTHYITTPLATGYITILSSLQTLYLAGQGTTQEGDAAILADVFNTGSDSQNKPGLMTLSPGDAFEDLSGTAAGRRVQLPWGDNTFDVAALNADGLAIMQRAIEWAEGAGVDPAPVYNVLMIVGNLTLSSKDVGYKALIESWGHTVSLIDDGDSQANYDTAMAAADVILASGSAIGSSILDKPTNTTKGIVNEVNGKIDNFGFSSSTSATANFDTFSTTSPTHYITESFAGNAVTVFTSSLTNPVPGGTLAPDLQKIGFDGGTLALGTLDTGATRYDSSPSTGRRVHLPYDIAETTDMTDDGKTILRRSLEWAAGEGEGAGGGGGGGPPPAGPAFEEFTDANGTGNTSLSIDKPAGTAAGDLLIAAVATDGNTAASLAPPAGWNVIHVADQGGNVTFGVWWKLAGASEPGTYSFSWSGSEHVYGWIMRFTGHDPANPIDVLANAGGDSGAPSSPSVTTTVDDTLILRLGGFDDDDITAGDPGLTGHTAINMEDSGNGPATASGGSGYVLQASAGASGTSAFSLTGTEEYVTVTIAIAPAP